MSVSAYPCTFHPPCLEKHMANEEASEKSVDLKLLESIFGRSGEPSGPKKERTPEELGQLRERINSLLRTLSYREREIVALRYGLGDGHTYTLEEVGNKFKVTRTRVRELEAEALRKLQKQAADVILD